MVFLGKRMFKTDGVNEETNKEVMREYTNGQIAMGWQPERLTHGGMCFAGLRQAFDPRRQPWVDLSKATSDEIILFCRCGASSTKPFCDGSHRKVGFPH
jgi:CDGSH-type Zn-finger protein